jgi:hypothetical protein
MLGLAKNLYNRIEENKKEVERTFPVGTRIQLIHMDDCGWDKHTVPDGTIGTVIGVDGALDLLMRWDNGSSLKLVIDADEFKVISKP